MVDFWWISVEALSLDDIPPHDVQLSTMIFEPPSIAIKRYYSTKDWETDPLLSVSNCGIASLNSSTSPCDNEAPFAEALDQVDAPSTLHFPIRMSAYKSNLDKPIHFLNYNTSPNNPSPGNCHGCQSLARGPQAPKACNHELAQCDSSLQYVS